MLNLSVCVQKELFGHLMCFCTWAHLDCVAFFLLKALLRLIWLLFVSAKMLQCRSNPQVTLWGTKVVASITRIRKACFSLNLRQQRMRWLNGITDSVDMSLSKLGVGDAQGGLACCSPWGCKELDTTKWLKWTELNWSFLRFCCVCWPLLAA